MTLYEIENKLVSASAFVYKLKVLIKHFWKKYQSLPNDNPIIPLDSLQIKKNKKNDFWSRSPHYIPQFVISYRGFHEKGTHSYLCPQG